MRRRAYRVPAQHLLPDGLGLRDVQLSVRHQLSERLAEHMPPIAVVSIQWSSGTPMPSALYQSLDVGATPNASPVATAAHLHGPQEE